MNELGAYIGAKIDEAVDAYDSSTESVKENIETIDDALAVSEERQKWKQVIKNIKAEMEKITPKVVHDSNELEIYNVRKYDIEIIDKYTKELMK